MKYDILDEEYCAWKRTVRITGKGRTNCDTFYTVREVERRKCQINVFLKDLNLEI